MRPLPWSHSSLEKFKNCPHAYHEIKVLKKFTEEEGDAALWGGWVHKQIEDHLNAGNEPPWHANMLPYVPHINRAIAWATGAGYSPGAPEHPGKLTYVEHELAIDVHQRPCAFDSPEAWARGIIDLLIMNGTTAYVLDWKTGKVKPDSDQLVLASMLVFQHFPWVEECQTSFEWLQHNTQTRAHITRAQVPDMWRKFIPKLTAYRDAFKTDTWQKRPSGLCRGWCAVESCQHWAPKR